jgi:hypothetical protein
MASRSLALVLVLSPLFGAEPVTWLDKDPKPWNRPGAAIPHAPRGAAREKFCSAPYKAQTPEEKQVAAAGWFLFSPSQVSNGIAIVGAEAFADGMCRPMEYQYFVFVNSVFAGTLSPARMSSRADASLTEVIPVAKDRLLATYSRYSDKDAMCCPSRISEARFVIHQESGRPVVTLEKTETKPAL